MQKYSVPTKYRATRFGTWVGLIGAVYSLKQLQGNTYNPHGAKVWFVILMVDIVLTIPTCIAYYYYRSKQRDVETGITAVQTLSALGAKKPNRSSARRKPYASSSVGRGGKRLI